MTAAHEAQTRLVVVEQAVVSYCALVHAVAHPVTTPLLATYFSAAAVVQVNLVGAPAEQTAPLVVQPV